MYCTMEVFGSDFKVILYLSSLQKFSNSQFTMQVFLVYLTSRILNKLLNFSRLFEIDK